MRQALLLLVTVASCGILPGVVRAEKYPSDGTTRSAVEQSTVRSSLVNSDDLLMTEVTTSLLSYEDSMYDFEVYAAEARTGWFIVWTLADGSTKITGPHVSEKSADDWIGTCLLHGWEPAGAVDSEIVELPLEPEWVLFETLPTRAEANALAALLQSVGLLTDIRRVGGIQMKQASLIAR